MFDGSHESLAIPGYGEQLEQRRNTRTAQRIASQLVDQLAEKSWTPHTVRAGFFGIKPTVHELAIYEEADNMLDDQDVDLAVYRYTSREETRDFIAPGRVEGTRHIHFPVAGTQLKLTYAHQIYPPNPEQA